MFCKIDGLVLGGVQFGVLVKVLVGVLIEVLMAVRAHLFKVDGRRVLGVMQFGVLAQVLFWGVAVRAHFCIFTVGCRGACSLGWWCWWWCGILFAGMLFAGSCLRCWCLRGRIFVILPSGCYRAGACLHLDDRVQGGMQFDVLAQVVFWDMGCCLRCGDDAGACLRD